MTPGSFCVLLGEGLAFVENHVSPQSRTVWRQWYCDAAASTQYLGSFGGGAHDGQVVFTQHSLQALDRFSAHRFAKVVGTRFAFLNCFKILFIWMHAMALFRITYSR